MIQTASSDSRFPQKPMLGKQRDSSEYLRLLTAPGVFQINTTAPCAPRVSSPTIFISADSSPADLTLRMRGNHSAGMLGIVVFTPVRLHNDLNRLQNL